MRRSLGETCRCDYGTTIQYISYAVHSESCPVRMSKKIVDRAMDKICNEYGLTLIWPGRDDESFKPYKP